MESSEELASRFRELYLDGTWIANTNYQMLLSNVNCEQAMQNVASLNTIAELTFHVNYYVEGVLNVLKGGDLTIRDQYSFDAPKLTSEESWNALKTRLLSNCEAVAKHIDVMSSSTLDAIFVDKKYGNYRRNIEGLIEHGYYHLGQMSLIKKFIFNDSL